MADLRHNSNSSGEDRGGVRLSDHSPPGNSSSRHQHHHSTPSSSASTIVYEKSPPDVFGPELCQGRVGQLYQQDYHQNYQLPVPPKFHTTPSQGSAKRSGPSHSQDSTSFSAGKLSTRSDGTILATPTGRPAAEPSSAGYRPAFTTLQSGFGPTPPAVKAPGNTPNAPDSEVRRAQRALPTISEEKGKLAANNLAHSKPVVAEMAAHCQIDGPLAGPIRDNRRSELARNHPAWIPARQVQAGIMTTQQAIRRTPGIPSKIANDLCDGLQKYAQDVNNMLRQAINEVADYRLDIEYNEKVLCSTKLEASIMLEERDNLKREYAELQSKHDEVENRLACYHVETEKYKNKLREYQARLDHENNGEETTQEIMRELVETVKEFLSRPTSQWLVTRNEEGSPGNVITALSASSIAALEQQGNETPRSQNVQKQLVPTRATIKSEHSEIMPSIDNALQPFNYQQQNAETSQISGMPNASSRNGPPTSYPGMFSNSRRPADNRTTSSAGWTRASSGASMQQPMLPARSYSRSGDARSSFNGDYKQPNEFDLSCGYGAQFTMQARPGTAMGHRGYNQQQSSFRPNAPEFHPGHSSSNGGFDNAESSYSYSYGPGSNAGSRRGLNTSTGPFESPTPRSVSRTGFGNFEGPSSGFTGASPLIPRTPGFGSTQQYNSAPTHRGSQSQRNHPSRSSVQNYHAVEYNHGGFTPGPFSHGSNGPRSVGKPASVTGTLASGTAFGQDDSGDNERYARAFEGVWGLARS
ncbi:hypothetical protein CGCSCA1_v013657 [Colletotrichum siamense]|nr:hypothetical protein CGCSCA1_v013657 [Colletotrichum siamense]